MGLAARIGIRRRGGGIALVYVGDQGFLFGEHVSNRAEVIEDHRKNMTKASRPAGQDE